MGDRFPAEHAAATVRHLATTIGLRIPGQPGFELALDWLRHELESIPGWEVAVQEAAAARDWGKTLVGTCHVNLVARLPGTEKRAILVNAHLDSPPSSVGAADDGAAVAVMLEAARLLAAGPRPRYSLIFLFNGSEEYVLQGAASFVEQHPWAKDVAAFINLEAAGCSGPFTLFQASAQLPALLKSYQGVARPDGSALAQDIFDARIFKNDTDYRVFAEHGLHGLDLALTGDGYAYHTWRDQPERLPLAALAEMGATLMTLLHRLDREPDLTPTPKPAGRVFFDLLNRVFITYPKSLSPILWAATALLGIYAVWGLPWWTGLLRHLAATLAALLVPIGAAWAMGKLTRFENWWWAHPTPSGIAWVALALAAMAAVQAAVPLPAQAGMAGAELFWLLLGALAAWKRLGSAFIPAAWSISGAAGLLLWPVSPLASAIVAVGGGALATATAFTMPMRFMLAHLGRNPFPSHLVVAGLFGLLTLIGAAFLPLPAVAIWVSLAAAAAALIAAALLPGVTPERPEQLNVTDLTHGGEVHQLCFPFARQFSPAVRSQLGIPQKLDEPLWKGHLFAPKAAVACQVPKVAAVAPPALEVVSDEAGEQRRITVHCVSTGYAVLLSTDVAPLEVTIDAGRGRPLMHGKQCRVRFVNPPPEGILVTFTLPAGAPCRLIASSWYLTDTGSAPKFPAHTSVLYQRAAATELTI
jgi:hypothetical protein